VTLEELREKLRADGKALVSVKVVPKSARNEIVGPMADGTLKVKVAAVPEKGKANAELCTFLARELGVPARNVEVVSGETSTLKRLSVHSGLR
jgi:uncharacterized protein